MPLLLAGVACLLTSCVANPVTERPQLMLVSDVKVDVAASGAYADMMEEAARLGLLDRDPMQTARVRGIAERLIARAVRYRPAIAHWQWAIHVFETDLPNAYCLAGGKIRVNSGLIRRLDPSDDELAQVLAHEIAHALSDHDREKLSLALVSRMTMSGIAAAQRTSVATLSRAFRDVFEEASTAPGKRQTEIEADRIGLRLAAEAGFDPAAAITLWERVRIRQGEVTASIFDRHPLVSARLDVLRQDAMELVPVYKEASRGR